MSRHTARTWSFPPGVIVVALHFAPSQVARTLFSKRIWASIRASPSSVDRWMLLLPVVLIGNEVLVVRLVRA